MRIPRQALAAVLLASAVVGCASLPPPLPPVATKGGTQYPLGAGDKIHVNVFNETALTGDYTVTAAGNVAFPLIGDVPAQGRTIEELQEALTEKLRAGYVKDARVSIEVLNYRPIYILGEVNRPGQFPFAIYMTVEQAIATAGGFTYRASRAHVRVRRGDDNRELSVDLKGPPAFVMPGDTIRVTGRHF